MKKISSFDEFVSITETMIATHPQLPGKELEVLTPSKPYNAFKETEYDLPEPDGEVEKKQFVGVRIKGTTEKFACQADLLDLS